MHLSRWPGGQRGLPRYPPGHAPTANPVARVALPSARSPGGGVGVAAGDQQSLVAVTGRSNRSKADQDPAQWLPPAAEVQCRYAGEWVGTQLRWSLTVDEPGLAALRELGDICPLPDVAYEPADG